MIKDTSGIRTQDSFQEKGSHLYQLCQTHTWKSQGLDEVEDLEVHMYSCKRKYRSWKDKMIWECKIALGRRTF